MQQGKAILVVIDGLGFAPALAQCGFLEAQVEAGTARCWKMRACLPTLSVPLYETLHTGRAPADHGILSNEAIRSSTSPNLFTVLSAAARKTAAVAHHFYFDLYCGRAYDKLNDIESDDESLPIQHGRYYSMDSCCRANPCLPAEIDLCAQANTLIRRFAPDYLLLHISAADTLGHFYTANSSEYRTQAWRTDNALARTLPLWRLAGYEIFVTSDHGINGDGHHGGNEVLTREVPFYYLGARNGTPAPEQILDQRCVAPTILAVIDAQLALGCQPSLFAG